MSKKKLIHIESAEVVFHQPIQEKKSYRSFQARTQHQKDAVYSILNNSISMLIGNAGTGKTSCSVGMASYLLENGKIDKIIISRPAIPVFEQIGFMPGDKDEKMLPFIMPMRSEFNKYMPHGEFDRLMKEGIIEVVPLCYLQGWNIDDRHLFIIDECALMNFDQFGLVLSRLCKGGRIVLMGDPAQDGGNGTGEAFDSVASKLDGVNGIGVVRFDESDNQRHELVNIISRKLKGASSRAPISIEKRMNGYMDEDLGKEWKILYR